MKKIEHDVFPPNVTVPKDFGCHGYFETFCGTTAEDCVKCWGSIKERPEFSKQKEN